MAACGKMVGKGYIAHPCEVLINQNGVHDGPCMSRDSQPSVHARQEWQKSQDELAQFQHEGTPTSFMTEGGGKAHPDHQRTYIPGLRGAVDNRAGRWAVCLGYEDEWFPLVDYATDDGVTMDTLPQYVVKGGETVLMVDSRREQPGGIQAQAQAFAIGGYTFIPAPRNRPPTGNTVLGDWDKATAANPDAVSTLEEPPPTPGEGDVWLDIISDMSTRREYGIEKYGQPVQPFNGRRALKDIYAEQLDMIVYMRQEITERAAIANLIRIAKAGFRSSDPAANNEAMLAIDVLIKMTEEWAS